MKKLRRVTEAEVIAEFLGSEFYMPDYDRDRGRFEALVLRPDLSNQAENAVRRALLFRRRGHMWRELPPDTQWWEVELEPEDLDRLRVFARAHWLRIAAGDFRVARVVERIRRVRFRGRTARFVSKIRSLSYYLRWARERTSVLLIGVDEQQPMVVWEGNHRLCAALLVSPELARERFRVLCGLSPRMAESCWYRVSLGSMWRYAKNRLRNLRDREADVERVLETVPAHALGYRVNTREPMTHSKP